MALQLARPSEAKLIPVVVYHFEGAQAVLGVFKGALCIGMARQTYRHKLGSFPDPVPLMVQGMQRLKKVVRERGMGTMLKKLLARGD